jgi:hypothetical protein
MADNRRRRMVWIKIDISDNTGSNNSNTAEDSVNKQVDGYV